MSLGKDEKQSQRMMDRDAPLLRDEHRHRRPRDVVQAPLKVVTRMGYGRLALLTAAVLVLFGILFAIIGLIADTTTVLAIGCSLLGLAVPIAIYGVIERRASLEGTASSASLGYRSSSQSLIAPDAAAPVAPARSAQPELH